MNPEVHIYRYVTEATFDAYLWQTIENKQKFISQIMTSKSPVRACDDIDEATLSYAEVKALCAGDDRIREKMDLDIEVSKLKLLKANHQSQQFRMQDDIARHYPEKIENYKQVIAGLEKDNNTAVSSPHPTDGFCGMKLNGSFYADKEEAGKAILDSCKSVTGAEPVSVGSYRGFSMGDECGGLRQAVCFDTVRRNVPSRGAWQRCARQYCSYRQRSLVRFRQGFSRRRHSLTTCETSLRLQKRR